jgi:hypothetical protein
VGVVLAGWLVCPPQALAENSIHQELAELAKAVQKQLEGFDETGVALEPFSGPADQAVNASPGINQSLREALLRLGLKVQPRARFALKGKYEARTEGKPERLLIHLSARLEDRNGKRIIELDARGVFGDEAVSTVLGLTAALPPGGNEKVRNEALLDQIVKPRVQVSSNRVSTKPATPYAVEILVKQGDKYEAREPQVENGQAYVPIKRGEVYAIRLVNDSPHEAAVTLAIDGINLFAFSEGKDPKTGRPPCSTLLIPPESSGVVQGWPINLKLSNEFLVTEYAKSAAAELKSPAAVGVITACFAAAWPKDGKPPADEPAKTPPGSRSGGDATGRGSPVETKYTLVERKFGVVRATVSVRYAK